MVNQLGKFSPHISELTQPMRELLSNKRAWLWGPSQEEAFNNVKEELSKPTTLALFNPDAELKISADACIFVWSRSSALSTGREQLETRGLCIQIDVRNRATLRPDRKRSLSSYMGL